MRYMLLLFDCDQPKPGEPGFEEALARVNAYNEELHRRGVFVSGDPLRPAATATTVRVRDGQTLITDGPYTETHELLGGYYVWDCKDLDEVLELVAACPFAAVGSVEIRPVAEVPGVRRL
jgi:hypothetical protein